jgi:hypothetical protein
MFKIMICIWDSLDYCFNVLYLYDNFYILRSLTVYGLMECINKWMNEHYRRPLSLLPVEKFLVAQFATVGKFFCVSTVAAWCFKTSLSSPTLETSRGWSKRHCSRLFVCFSHPKWTGVAAQAMYWTTGVWFPVRVRFCSLFHGVETGFESPTCPLSSEYWRLHLSGSKMAKAWT